MLVVVVDLFILDLVELQVALEDLGVVVLEQAVLVELIMELLELQIWVAVVEVEHLQTVEAEMAVLVVQAELLFLCQQLLIQIPPQDRQQ
jgi:hypothetical protein